jgi:hypothetical protein
VSGCGLAAGLLLLAVQAVLAAPTTWLAVDGNIQFQGTAGTTYDWANSGAVSPVNVCPLFAVNLSGSGGIFNCGRQGGGGAPPIPPTLTPTAAADPSIISAVFIADPIATDTTACSGDPTVVAGGAKNGDALNTITTTSGSVPGKDDLSNVYAVSHTRADTGHPEMFFAAERLVNNGDSHIDFEFLQSSVGVTAACSGSFTGNRTEGDLLVAVDFTNGGSLAGASVWQWHCNADPGPPPQPADGTVCDPGGLSAAHYEQIAVPSFLTLTVNAAADIPCGGWVCRLGAGTTVPQNDFLEGGIDLAGIPFDGCFNSFLPHTRTAQSFTAGLKDFAGPVSFHSCRTAVQASNSSPSGGGVSPGTAATDSVTVGNGGAGPAPTGSVTFSICQPSQLTGGSCPSGGTQVGAVKTLIGGGATSDPTSATTAFGKYCWRTVFTPDLASTGVFAPGAHTNTTTECFGVAGAGLPNTGSPIEAGDVGRDLAPVGGAVLPLLMLIAPVRRRTIAAAVLAVTVLAAVSVAPPGQAPPARAATPHQRSAAIAMPADTPTEVTQSGTRTIWRLVIEKLGVDARIEPVDLDAAHAMAAPSSLSTVGWYDRGPSPGEPGDAVIDGHYGLPSDPAVFRNLHALSAGDLIVVIWPDGRHVSFRVTSSALIARDARPPAGLFARTGSPRLSLITCGGAWQQDQATYTQRLIITALAV